MKLIGGLGRLGDKVTSQFGKVAQEISGKEVFNPTSAHSIVTEALEKKRSAEALARRLWMSFVIEGRESLSREDIREVLGPARREEADEAFECIDMDDNGDISLDEMIMKVVGISREAKAIANSMHDISGAIGVLDNVLMVIAGIIIVFVFVAFLNASFVTTLATAGTTLLSLSFVFAVTCQEFLGSCIFLFVKHPYDVGDRVDIKGPEQEALVVEQISLLYTVFRRIDYMKTVQVPNIVLNTMWIENVSRSTAMKEQLELSISFDTSMEDLELLRKEMEAFVRAPENARDFQPDLVLECTGVGTMDKLVLRVEIRHKSNWGNETVRAARRSKFMCALVLALRKIPIFAPGGGGAGLGDPANPSYSVTVTDEMAAAARKKFEEEKEANRLVPSKKQEDEVKGDESSGKSTAVDLGPAREVAAAAALNHRNPGDDRGHDEKSMAALKQEDSNDSRRRSSEIESLREVLVRRQSTRGRRRPGVTIPPTSMGGTNPSLGVIPTSPLSSRLRDDYGRIDEEEAETGMGMQTGNPYTTPAYGQYGLAPPPLNPGAAGGVQQVRSAPPGAQGYQGPSQTQGAQTQPGNNTSSGGGQPNPYLNFPTAQGQGPPAPPK
jgi:small-conductance mechanosensitive channel